MCGADATAIDNCVPGDGSPPRVRSRPDDKRRGWRRLGITSACAEQTRFRTCAPSALRDHLRVCGADSFLSDVLDMMPGSPPRVRSRLLRERRQRRNPRITSACAEQTRRLC